MWLWWVGVTWGVCVCVCVCDSLGEHEGDKMPQVHGLGGGASPSVQIEWFVVGVCIQYALHISAYSQYTLKPHSSITVIVGYLWEKKIPRLRKWCGFCFVTVSIFCNSSSLILWLPNCPGADIRSQLAWAWLLISAAPCLVMQYQSTSVSQCSYWSVSHSLSPCLQLLREPPMVSPPARPLLSLPPLLLLLPDSLPPPWFDDVHMEVLFQKQNALVCFDTHTMYMYMYALQGGWYIPEPPSPNTCLFIDTCIQVCCQW